MVDEAHREAPAFQVADDQVVTAGVPRVAHEQDLLAQGRQRTGRNAAATKIQSVSSEEPCRGLLSGIAINPIPSPRVLKCNYAGERPALSTILQPPDSSRHARTGSCRISSSEGLLRAFQSLPGSGDHRESDHGHPPASLCRQPEATGAVCPPVAWDPMFESKAPWRRGVSCAVGPCNAHAG